jgi:hypothetical protein
LTNTVEIVRLFGARCEVDSLDYFVFGDKAGYLCSYFDKVLEGICGVGFTQPGNLACGVAEYRVWGLLGRAYSIDFWNHVMERQRIRSWNCGLCGQRLRGYAAPSGNPSGMRDFEASPLSSQSISNAPNS